MNAAVTAYRRVSTDIATACANAGRAPNGASLVVVSKTQTAATIEPMLAAGHRIFGENRVQEAKAKWPDLKRRFPGVELHLIGPLQSNKVVEAVALFDVIETIDREKIAVAVAKEMKTQGRSPKLLVQVNTGAELQKAGVLPEDLTGFLNRLRNDLGLTISGLMCIPPVDEAAAPHFRMLRDMATHHDLQILSMGMSADYETAIAEGATHVRVGSAIFGARPA